MRMPEFLCAFFFNILVNIGIPLIWPALEMAFEKAANSTPRKAVASFLFIFVKYFFVINLVLLLFNKIVGLSSVFTFWVNGLVPVLCAIAEYAVKKMKSK